MVARDLAEQNTLFLDEPGQWKETIKTRLIALEFTYPEDPSAIVQAMEQVRYALARLGVKPASFHRRHQWTSLSPLASDIAAQVLHRLNSTRSGPGSKPSPPDKEPR